MNSPLLSSSGDYAHFSIPLEWAWRSSRIYRKTCRSKGLQVMAQERPSRVERRLSAILAADVAGYSRLMHHDEEATVETNYLVRSSR